MLNRSRELLAQVERSRQLRSQYAEQANAIANQAQALAVGRIPEGRRYAQVLKLQENVATLLAWTPDDRNHTLNPKADPSAEEPQR